MKNIFLAILVVLSGARSFGQVIDVTERKKLALGRPLDSIPKPFVILKTGPIEVPDHLKDFDKWFHSWKRDFYMSDVVEYSDGTQWFKRYSHGIMTSKQYQGKINIWSAILESYSSSGALTSINEIHYLQMNETGKLLPMTAANVKRIIPKEDSAYKYMVLYDKTRQKGNKIMRIGLGIVAAGIATTAVSPDHSNVALGGIIGTLGGVFTIVGGFSHKSRADVNIDYAVAAYNGVLKE